MAIIKNYSLNKCIHGVNPMGDVGPLNGWQVICSWGLGGGGARYEWVFPRGTNRVRVHRHIVLREGGEGYGDEMGMGIGSEDHKRAESQITG